ncbi:MAG: hypothetical protein ACTSP3_00095 [Candidatus Heimdallarchaeaceae archaeon]
MNNENTKRNLVINSVVSLFAHEHANSLLTRSFTECNEDEHKNDCMRKVLEKAINERDLFIIQLESIINLHSKTLVKNKNLVIKLNRILGLINVKYDINKEMITAEHVPSVLLSKDEKYLYFDTSFVTDSFYKRLIDQINITFLDGCFSATTILVRKLFENLLIDLLRKKFSNKKEEHLFWNVEKERFWFFSKIIKNFNSKLTDFKKYSDKLDRTFVKFLNESIRYQGNQAAHSIEDQISKEDLEKRKKQINNYIEVLFSVFSKI